MKRKKTILAIISMIFCTLFTSLGQLFWKIGSSKIQSITSFILNKQILFGFIFCAIGSILLIMALSQLELSFLYPMMSLGFVWTLILSYFILNENIYISKIVGTFLIISAILILGIGGSKK